MNQILIESILGLLSGLFMGITGILPSSVMLLVLDVLKIGDYKSNLGVIMLLNVFPLTIGSTYEFYKSHQINYSLSLILLLTIMLGSFIGSKFVTGEKGFFSTKDIKYMTAYFSLFIGLVFLYSAYYEKN
jgi:uncharacterized membrane protein YfcA